MEMVLPRNYVEIEQEEMMYLDGGAKYLGTFSGFTGWATAAALVTTGGLLAATGGFVGKAAYGMLAMGPIGWIATIVVAFNGAAMSVVGSSISGTGGAAATLMSTRGSFRLYQGNTPWSILSAS